MPLVVVPWRGGCAHRERAWAWVRRKLEAVGWQIVVAEAPPGSWCKAAAVMPVIEQSAAEVVVFHDADVWSEGLPEAVDAVLCGASWAIPHRGVFRLTEESTERLIGGDEDFEAMTLDQPPYLGMAGGGVTVLRREVAVECPMDPRFSGWGQEDEALGFALTTLYGPPVRVKRPLVHLWHPPQERLSRRYGSVAGRALFRRYHQANDNPDLMRTLIEEIHEHHASAQPTGGDRQLQRVG